MVGNTARATAMAQDLVKHYRHTRYIRAQLSLNRKDPAAAADTLQAALPLIEYGQFISLTNMSCLYPTYLRGQAYLAAGQGKEVAAEFQKMLDHSGIIWNCCAGGLGGLGVARAHALQAQNPTGSDAGLARTRAFASGKDFLTLWKDADPEIPIYEQAKAEYAKLQ